MHLVSVFVLELILPLWFPLQSKEYCVKCGDRDIFIIEIKQYNTELFKQLHTLTCQYDKYLI